MKNSDADYESKLSSDFQKEKKENLNLNSSPDDLKTNSESNGIVPTSEDSSNSTFEPLQNDFVISERSPGLCIIFDYEKYDDPIMHKHDSRIDVNSLKSTFENFFCEIEIHSNCSKTETKDKFLAISQENYTNYNCIVIFILSHGAYGLTHCCDGEIKTQELIDLVAKNKYLQEKPKLFFINACHGGSDHDVVQRENAINIENPFTNSELFVFISPYARQRSYRIPSGTGFIYELCNILNTYHHKRHDLFKMITMVIKQIAKTGKGNSPIIYSTLTESVVFKSEEQMLRQYVGRGRFLLLNYSQTLDTSPLLSAYVDLNFLIKPYDHLYLDYKLDDIQRRESQNSTENCNRFVFCLFPEQIHKTFLTNFENRFPTIDDVSNYFSLSETSDIKIKELEKYYFINSKFVTGDSKISEQNGYYYFESRDNRFVSCNAFPINHATQMLNCYNYPKSIEIMKFERKYCPDDSFGQVLLNQFSNSIKFENFDCIKNLENLNFKNFVYDTRGVSKGQAVVLYHDDDDKDTEKLENFFENQLYFQCQPLKIETKMDLSDLLCIEETANCYVLFILAECKNDTGEFIFKGNLEYKFSDLIKTLKNSTSLAKKPKLIFVQNLENESFKINFDLPEDFLMLISQKQNESHFIDEFCQILSENYVEYDLLTILQKLNILKSFQISSTKVTLNKALFFNKFLMSDMWETVETADFFNEKCNGTINIMRYAYEFQNESAQLDNKFRELNIQTKRVVFNMYSGELSYFEDEYRKGHLSKIVPYDPFVVMFLSEQRNYVIIMNLIKHLANIVSFIGKPIVLFLLGHLHYTMEDLRKFNQDNHSRLMKCTIPGIEELAKKRIIINYRLEKANLIVYHSNRVSETVDSICKIFNNDNVNQYDMASLLLKVSSDVMDEPITQVADSDRQFINVLNFEKDLSTILQTLNIVKSDKFYSIKSTLTKSLFFKRHLTNDELEIIKNGDFFYRKGQGRCHLMRYGDNCFESESEELEKKFIELNFETSTQVFDNGSLKRMLDNDMLHNHYAYDGFFVVMFLNETTNSEYIMNLIEHLTEVESLIGKPKILFLLGPLKYRYNLKPTSKGQFEKYTEDFRLSKYADLLVFSSDKVEQTITSICTIWNDENVEKYDLVTLLLLVSSNVDSVHDSLNVEQQDGTENKDKITPKSQNLTQTCINSTLTRLVSVSKNRYVDILNKKLKYENKFKECVEILPIKKRGKYLIFNSEVERKGTNKDYDLLAKTFKKLCLENGDTESTLMKMSKKDYFMENLDKFNFTGYHCIVVVFLSHGDANDDMDFPNFKINRNEIIKVIAKNSTLERKPKFFFSQTCRGENREPSTGDTQKSIITTLNSPLATYPDLFVFFPSFEGCKSWRDEHSGTWFIQELCNLLDPDQNSLKSITGIEECDIFTIATIVTRIVCRKNGELEIENKPEKVLAKETPTFYSTLKHSYSFSIKQ